MLFSFYDACCSENFLLWVGWETLLMEIQFFSKRGVAKVKREPLNYFEWSILHVYFVWSKHFQLSSFGEAVGFCCLRIRNQGMIRKTWTAFLGTWKCWAGNQDLVRTRTVEAAADAVCQAPFSTACAFSLALTTWCEWCHYVHSLMFDERTSPAVCVWGPLESSSWPPFQRRPLTAGKRKSMRKTFLKSGQ